jgi:protein-S-isoprenylcysteine O-methyltransferase Ste14
MAVTRTQKVLAFIELMFSTLSPKVKGKTLIYAFFYGITCHFLFAIAVIAMIFHMFYGMQKSFGNFEGPLAIISNGALIVQFPLMHSFLLSKRGQNLLNLLGPKNLANSLTTTSFTIIASLQLLCLFMFWSPSKIMYEMPFEFLGFILPTLYFVSWILLIVATIDAGLEVQSGALGWVSVLTNRKPVFPPLPTKGLYSVIRHPIYASFFFAVITVPTWTADQLVVSVILGGYCIFAPILKDRRLMKRHGDEYLRYKNITPYMIPVKSMKDT